MFRGEDGDSETQAPFSREELRREHRITTPEYIVSQIKIRRLPTVAEVIQSSRGAGSEVGARPGRAVVHGLLSDPEVPAAGVPERDASDVRGMVSGRALGDANGAHRPAPQPDQPSGDQAEDVEMEEETTRASTPSALEENLSRGSGYAPLNGIGVRL